MDSEEQRRQQHESLDAFYIQGRQDEALTIAMQLLEQSPDDYKALSIAFELFVKRQNFSSARAILTRATGADRTDIRTRHYWFDLLNREGRPDEAVAAAVQTARPWRHELYSVLYFIREMLFEGAKKHEPGFL